MVGRMRIGDYRGSLIPKGLTMADLLPTLRVATWVVHASAAIVLAALLATTGVMAGWCVVPGALIACAAVSASPGRPVTLYAAFGALMGFSFWQGVSSIHSGHLLGVIPSVLLIAGASWFLREPGWPSFAFTGVVVALWAVLLAWFHDKRFELDNTDPADAIRIVRTSVVVLSVGAVYGIVGFAEVLLGRARRKKKSRALRTPAGPPML